MSGTSADAVDASVVDIRPDAIRVIASAALPIPSSIRTQIIALFDAGSNEIERMGALDRSLGELFADAVHQLLAKSGIPASAIRAIGSHGQTIRHRPRPDAGLPFTLQIADPNTIAERTGITTVADFRRRDVACGGQGAPLTPAFHDAVFAADDEVRGVLNIGGIANLTILNLGQPVLGFDTGPGNGLMDAWISHCQGKSYDINGQWAATGKVDQPLLEQLLLHPFFQLSPPKSTGREEFTLQWLLMQLARCGDRPAHDVQATLAELTAISISAQIERQNPVSRLFLCGGGAHNDFLLKRIQAYLPNCLIQTTAELGIPVDDVEAAAFAWLAHQTMERLSGNLPSVTGAKRAVVLGGVYSGTLNTEDDGYGP
jgi:anhydro-N-acetylmuramic acid kinase